MPLRRSWPAKIKAPTMVAATMISEYQRSEKVPMWRSTGSISMVM